MQYLHNRKLWALVALAAVAAVAAMTGHPLVSPEMLAGLGMVPLAVGNTDLADIKSIIVQQGDAWSEFKKTNDKRIGDLEASLDDLFKKSNRPSNPGATGEDGHSTKLGAALRKAFQGDDTELKAMQVGSDPEGGYLTVPTMDSQVRSIREQVSPMSSLAREITLTSGDAAVLPFIRGTLESTWVGEVEARPDTDTLPVGANRIQLHEHYACPAVTQKLLDTSNYEIGSLILEQIGHGLAVSEASAIYSGNGVAKPRGLGTYSTAAESDAARDWGVIEHVPTGASGAWHTTKLDPLFDVVATLQPQYRANAVWMLSRATFASIRKLKEATSDRYLIEPDLQTGAPARLLGYPIVINDNVAAIGANSLSVWFGDMRQAYAIVRQPGVKLLRDPYTSKGQVKFYAYARVGGDLVNSEAVKALKFAAS